MFHLNFTHSWLRKSPQNNLLRTSVIDNWIHWPKNEVTLILLAHWGRETHLCASKLAIIGLYNDLSPGRWQAIIWTNAGTLLIGTLGLNFSQIVREILALSLTKMHLKMSSAKLHQFCLGLSVLICNLNNSFGITDIAMHIHNQGTIFFYSEVNQNKKLSIATKSCLLVMN